MRDSSVSQQLSDDEVRDMCRRLREVEQMMIDGKRIDEFVKVIEVLYGVEYDEPDYNEVDEFRTLARSINADEATDLDPSFVELVVEEFERELDDMEQMVQAEYFEGVPIAR